MSRVVVFGWFGGKASHLNFILPNLPKCRHYVEPFGGSAAVLLNREPSPIETYNDLNGDLVNFFRVLRDRGPELQEKLELTLYAREEFRLALEPCENELERARRFYIRVRQAFKASMLGNSWSREYKNPIGIPRWLNGIECLPDCYTRFKHVQIDHLNALNLIQKYDSPDTLFYCDPPYVWDFKDNKFQDDYGIAHSVGDAAVLARSLHSIQGLAAISNYAGVYDDLYHDWRRLEDKPKVSSAALVNRAIRQEILWCNYDKERKRL